MALIDNDTFQASSELSLWFKLYTGDSLTLADLPEIIPMRWSYFRDNWNYLKLRLQSAAGVRDLDYFRETLNGLTDFIDKQRFDTTDTNPFAHASVFFRFYPVFDAIKLGTIPLTQDETKLLTNKQLTIQGYSKVNFLKIKNTLRAYRDYLADTVGLSDPSYDAIYDRASVVGDTTVSLADMSLMQVIERQLSSVDFILSNLFAVDTAIDPFALARLNANNPDINIGQYKSGKLVKLNSGEDLPSLAKRFFGNADKWINIAIANGLKEPYVDEIGTKLLFLANGSNNQISIAATDPLGNDNISRFYINQLILISSNTNPFPTQRAITGIKQIPLSGEIVLTVNGAADMNSYLLADGANIRVFKPNTINSSQYILIPSEKPLTNTRVDEVPWFLAGNAADERNTKVDIAISDSGALLQNTNGDLTLRYGLDNAIQAIRAKMLTELGTNRRHPNYGLINLVGTPTNQSDNVKTALVKAINDQITQDSRFDRVHSLDVTKRTNSQAVVYDVALVVKLAGSDTLLPITFTVNS